jgi:lipopolysaccharide/colanic/teichoic acid biosynthesis glycosyltransferase
MPPGIPRHLEIILSLIGLILASPLLLLAAVLIRGSSPGPILFRQQRMGRAGKTFELFKFRSMRIDNAGAQVTAKGDTRITCVGRWLRKSKLDEFPELWNVARGDLSLVGPRPEVPKYVDLNNPLWHYVLEARPGITDPVTLRLRNEEELLAGCEGNPEQFYLDVLQPYKLQGYAEYLRRRSWRTDVYVILETLIAVIFPAKAPPPGMDEIENKVLP